MNSEISTDIDVQFLTFIRLLGKTKEDVHPRDTNLDYLMYLFAEHKELIHPPANK